MTDLISNAAGIGARMIRLITGVRVTPAIDGSDAISPADRPYRRTAGAGGMADAGGLTEDATYRFLTACASLDFVDHDSQRRFRRIRSRASARGWRSSKSSVLDTVE